MTSEGLKFGELIMSEKNKEKVQNEAEQENVSEVQIRRQKLAALCEKGRNPFQITTCPRNITAQEIRGRFEEL